MSPITLAKQSSFRSQTSRETKENKKGFLKLSKSINPTASPLLNDAIKEQIVLYTKLFLIMGLSWILEILEPLLLDTEKGDQIDHCNTRVNISIHSCILLP